MVEPNLVVLAACVHSELPTCFDVLNDNYLGFLLRVMYEKGTHGCSCLYFLGKRKQTMLDLLRKPMGE
jgi:hypothetical protein